MSHSRYFVVVVVSYSYGSSVFRVGADSFDSVLYLTFSYGSNFCAPVIQKCVSIDSIKLSVQGKQTNY